MATEEYPAGSRFIGPAIVQLNGLSLAGVLGSALENATVEVPGSPVFDINGEVLFQRVALHQSRVPVGYVDVAEQATLGEPILAIGISADWSGPEVLRAGRDIAVERYGLPADAEPRLVAYSFPKLAVQILEGGEELIMLEVGSWEPVPQQTDRRRGEPPGNFERWSLLEEMDEDRASGNRERLERTVEELAAFEEVGRSRIISSHPWPSPPSYEFVVSRELHYSPVNTDHFICYQLRPQQTSVWCVAASVEMLLDFYRYDYEQTRVASQLDLGTLAAPIGLPYSRDGDVVTSIEALTGSALKATMVVPGSFDLFVTEIDANRPVISFIPGHSRTVAGYTQTIGSIESLNFEGLLVYDPWPPNAGVITRWENYKAATYRKAFTTTVTLH